MHLFDLGLLPRLLTDQTKGIADETAADHERMGRQLDALFVALLPVGMRVVCLETVGIVAGWTRMPGAPVTDPLSPFFAHAEPFTAGPGSVNPATGFVTRSNTHLPALRAQIIVDAATIPHLCKVIAESYGWAPTIGEAFGIRRNEGTGRAGVPGFRWTVHSTHSAAWDLDFGHGPMPQDECMAITATLIRRIEEIASAYLDADPMKIGETRRRDS